MTTNRITAIGIDIDGTITLDPEFYAEFSRKCRQTGVFVHVVSARPRDSIDETAAELQELEITYDELHLLPPMEEAIILCPHAEIEVFHRHFWMKVDYAKRQQLSHFVDDNERVLQLFRLYAPEISIVQAAEYPRLSELIQR